MKIIFYGTLLKEKARKGKIKGRKIGKNWYVLKGDLEAFLEGKG